MPVPSVDDLRRDLRERGYLSHAIERWFAHDPFTSRAFWLELATGLELDEQGSAHELSPAEERQRRKQLRELGGPPPALAD